MVLALGLRTHKTDSITGADSNPRRRELTLSGSVWGCAEDECAGLAVRVAKSAAGMGK